MPITIGDGLSFCGHSLSESELDLIRSITREFASLTLTELAATLCELLEWRRPNGGLKSRQLNRSPLRFCSREHWMRTGPFDCN